MSHTETIARVARLCRDAERILFITGAGVSADSGLPTYRGVSGLYEDRLTEEDIPIETALSGQMLRHRPAIAWKHIARIEAACRGARPNAAHRVIAALERIKPGVTVLTQNVDGLHHAAGSRNLIEIHGSVHHLFCTRCDWHQEVEDYADLQLPPACPECGALVRPDVVLFGEMLPEAAVVQLEETLEEGVDLVLTIGTTSVFPYIAGPVQWARQEGIPSVEINPGDSRVSGIVDYRLKMGAADALSAIWRALGLHVAPDPLHPTSPA